MRKQYLPLLLAPLISCGCPKDGPDPSTSSGTAPTVTVTATASTAPTVSAPKPKATINWLKASDKEVLEQAKAGKCLVVWFQSNKPEVHRSMEQIVADDAVVKVVNERFVSMIWDGDNDIRTQFFGVGLHESSLLVVPKNDSSFLLFNAFNEEGEPKAPLKDISAELARGLSLDVFADCVQ